MASFSASKALPAIGALAARVGSELALQEIARRKPILKNRVEPEVEQAVVEIAVEQPTWGKSGCPTSYASVAWRSRPSASAASGSADDLENMKKRPKALEAKIAQDAILLTESQGAAMEEAKHDKEAHGESDSECPGYCVAQDTFYVDTLKEVGRVYQQNAIDTYSKLGFAKLYDEKTSITAADTLNDRVLPFFEEYEISVRRVLTDRRTEYCGTPQSHPYELYLAVENIDHTRTKAKSPQTNGICERFNKTILQELYQAALRGKLYNSIAELRMDLNTWIPTITPSGPTRAAGAMARRRCRPSSTRCRSPRRSCCRLRDRTSYSVGHPPRRGQPFVKSSSYFYNRSGLDSPGQFQRHAGWRQRP